MSGVSKEERDRLGDEICWKELHLIPYHATSLTVCGLLDALDDADKKIAELERENARIHELYSLDRAEHDSRGGA